MAVCDRNMNKKISWKVYRRVVRSALVYGRRHGHWIRYRKRNWTSPKCKCYDGYAELQDNRDGRIKRNLGNIKESPGKELESA